VQCPTLLLVGEELFALSPSERIAAATPGVRLVRLPATGHWVPLDNPQGFIEVVTRFLAEET
jgi:pimeloyl-ACP methyl ester carboxylesterase